MKFTVDGVGYDIDLESLSLDEGEIIEDYAGSTIAEFADALRAVKVRPIRALVLIAKRRAGEDVEWADLGNLDLMELAMSIIEDNGVDLSVVGAGQDPAAMATLTKMLAARRRPAAKPVQRKKSAG